MLSFDFMRAVTERIAGTFGKIPEMVIQGGGAGGGLIGAGNGVGGVGGSGGAQALRATEGRLLTRGPGGSKVEQLLSISSAANVKTHQYEAERQGHCRPKESLRGREERADTHNPSSAFVIESKQ